MLSIKGAKPKNSKPEKGYFFLALCLSLNLKMGKLLNSNKGHNSVVSMELAQKLISFRIHVFHNQYVHGNILAQIFNEIS